MLLPAYEINGLTTIRYPRHPSPGLACKPDMSLLVEHRRERWPAVGLLAAAAALSACTVTTQLPISPTETPAPAPIEMRPLSANEKTALAKALAQTVPNPAAQFKWLPIATHGSGPIGYCGLINVKSKA